MEEKHIKAFNAIVTFINDLWEVFGDTKIISPLSLYKRLIDHIRFTDAEAINKSLSKFREFLVEYESNIINDLTSIPSNTIIKYGDNNQIYIEISDIISRSDASTRNIIRQHLITISSILDPNKKKIEELEKKIEILPMDTNSPEGEFISGIVNKAKNSMQNIDTNNPMQAIAGLLQTGVISDMMTGLQSGIGSGKMDIRKLFGTMQNTINSLMPPQEEIDNSLKEKSEKNEKIKKPEKNEKIKKPENKPQAQPPRRRRRKDLKK